MKVNISRWMRHGMLGIMLISVSSTGCSTGSWKMPSSKLFSWGKKPDEKAIASSSLTYPESPATKQSPSTLASAGTKPGTPLPTGPLASKTTGNAYTPPSSNGLSSYTPPGAGLAATANGYATGTYNTFGQSPAANALANNGVPSKAPTGPAMTPSSSFAPPTAPSTPSALQIPTANGYAASNPFNNSNATPSLPTSQFYAGAGSGAGTARPTGFAAAPIQAQAGGAATLGTPPAPKPTAPATGFTAGIATSGTPPIAGFAGSPTSSYPTTPTSMPNTGAYSPIGAAPSTPTGLAQAAPSFTPPTTNFAPPAQTTGFAPPSGAPGSSFSQIPAQTASYTNQASTPATTASYRPGSTSRATGYNFGATAPATPAAVAGFQPTNPFPNTANSYSNPGYSIPPSSSLNR